MVSLTSTLPWIPPFGKTREGDFILHDYGRDIPFLPEVLVEGKSYICDVGTFKSEVFYDDLKDLLEENSNPIPRFTYFVGLRLPKDALKEHQDKEEVYVRIRVGYKTPYKDFFFWWNVKNPTQHRCEWIYQGSNPVW